MGHIHRAILEAGDRATLRLHRHEQMIRDLVRGVRGEVQTAIADALTNDHAAVRLTALNTTGIPTAARALGRLSRVVGASIPVWAAGVAETHQADLASGLGEIAGVTARAHEWTDVDRAHGIERVVKGETAADHARRAVSETIGEIGSTARLAALGDTVDLAVLQRVGRAVDALERRLIASLSAHTAAWQRETVGEVLGVIKAAVEQRGGNGGASG